VDADKFRLNDGRGPVWQCGFKEVLVVIRRSQVSGDCKMPGIVWARETESKATCRRTMVPIGG